MAESKTSIIKRLMRDVTPRKTKITVADALEFRREAYGLTASEFAAVLGMRQSLQWRIMRPRGQDACNWRPATSCTRLGCFQ